MPPAQARTRRRTAAGMTLPDDVIRNILLLADLKTVTLAALATPRLAAILSQEPSVWDALWARYLQENGTTDERPYLPARRKLELTAKISCELCGKARIRKVHWPFAVRCCKECLYANTVSSYQLEKELGVRPEEHAGRRNSSREMYNPHACFGTSAYYTLTFYWRADLRDVLAAAETRRVAEQAREAERRAEQEAKEKERQAGRERRKAELKRLLSEAVSDAAEEQKLRNTETYSRNGKLSTPLTPANFKRLLVKMQAEAAAAEETRRLRAEAEAARKQRAREREAADAARKQRRLMAHGIGHPLVPRVMATIGFPLVPQAGGGTGLPLVPRMMGGIGLPLMPGVAGGIGLPLALHTTHAIAPQRQTSDATAAPACWVQHPAPLAQLKTRSPDEIALDEAERRRRKNEDILERAARAGAQPAILASLRRSMKLDGPLRGTELAGGGGAGESACGPSEATHCRADEVGVSGGTGEMTWAPAAAQAPAIVAPGVVQGAGNPQQAHNALMQMRRHELDGILAGQVG